MRWRITIAVTCAALLAMTACSDRPDVDLAAALRLADDLQGHFDIEMVSGGQTLVLHLPISAAVHRSDPERVAELPSTKA